VRSKLLCALVATSCDASSTTTFPDARSWATYTIEPGQHSAELAGREPKNPIDGVTDTEGRDYELALDPSAIYELTNPTEPTDQLDWNKLPGLSDCGTLDLSVNGAMFGWRWNLVDERLEITAYANNNSQHLATDVLVRLDASDLDAREPLRYRVYREPSLYGFRIEGTIRGRAITATTELPRACPTEVLDVLAWAGAFYFGGTSVAPHTITARVRETPFVR
jgi:hypothetical protein